ncbi:hypothetical protein [Salmonirosea aquatica]|uniref:hypothetical protein n=1 Tax=Salmonirosea aquatica TaxID=2654236 RepID=UPI0035709CD0
MEKLCAMKIKKNLSRWGRLGVCLVLLSSVWMSACEGPEGPAGPAGPSGAQGPTGAQGPAGPTGTANVVYSSWIRAGTWTKTNVFGVDRFYTELQADRLSQEILDRGVVLVYAKLETDNNQVRQLPVTVYAQFTEDIIDFSLILAKVRVWSTPVRGPALPVAPSPNHSFRYVLIPGGQAGRISYEKLTYAEAAELFGFSD